MKNYSNDRTSMVESNIRIKINPSDDLCKLLS